MDTSSKQSLRPLEGEQGKYKENSDQLKSFLFNLRYFPEVSEHRTIAKRFEVVNYRPIFRADAIRRFINATYSKPTTAATIEKITRIKHKYICELKDYLEKKGHIKVVGFGVCETTFSKGVQFLSSNNRNWNDEFHNSNQLNLF